MYMPFKDTVVCSVSRGRVTVVFENLNEGYNGDYNPLDPNDEILLRFTVYKDDEEVPDASYCTTIPYTEKLTTIYSSAKKILDTVYEPVMNDISVKKICEYLSWV